MQNDIVLMKTFLGKSIQFNRKTGYYFAWVKGDKLKSKSLNRLEQIIKNKVEA